MTAEALDVELRLGEFIRRELLASDVVVDRDDDLLSGELLDSMSVMRLATFVADEFDFEIQPADYVIENFQSIAALTAYVLRATDRAA